MTLRLAIKQDKKGWYIHGIPGKIIYYNAKWKAERYLNRIKGFKHENIKK